MQFYNFGQSITWPQKLIPKISLWSESLFKARLPQFEIKAGLIAYLYFYCQVNPWQNLFDPTIQESEASQK